MRGRETERRSVIRKAREVELVVRDIRTGESDPKLWSKRASVHEPWPHLVLMRRQASFTNPVCDMATLIRELSYDSHVSRACLKNRRHTSKPRIARLIYHRTCDVQCPSVLFSVCREAPSS